MKLTKRAAQLILGFVFSHLIAGAQDVTGIRDELLDPASKRVLVASHRAEHHIYPENSLDAIREAIKLGVDIIEIDVKVSRDGVPFLMHDRTMNRTTNGTGDPEKLDWPELQKFHLVDKGIQTSYAIPTLREALQLARGKIMVDLDLKTDRIGQILKVVDETGTRDIVFFFDSDYQVLSRVRKSGADLMIMPRAHSMAEADSAINLFDPPIVHIDPSFYSDACMNVIRNGGARAWINALGEYDDAIRNGNGRQAIAALLRHGASIIQTDEPATVLHLLEANGYRPERNNILISR